MMSIQIDRFVFLGSSGFVYLAEWMGFQYREDPVRIYNQPSMMGNEKDFMSKTNIWIFCSPASLNSTPLHIIFSSQIHNIIQEVIVMMLLLYYNYYDYRIIYLDE